jgi:hypothetical protein
MKAMTQSLIDAQSAYRDKWLEYRYAMGRLRISDLEPVRQAIEFAAGTADVRFASVHRAEMEAHALHLLILVAIKILRFDTYLEFAKQYEEYKDKLGRGVVEVLA